MKHTQFKEAINIETFFVCIFVFSLFFVFCPADHGQVKCTDKSGGGVRLYIRRYDVLCLEDVIVQPAESEEPGEIFLSAIIERFKLRSRCVWTEQLETASSET
jgi:hypothetical protein